MSKQNYKDVRKKIEELERQATATARTYLEEESKRLFAENPKLKSFGWVQFSVYFNDGDPTYFSAHRDQWEVLVNDYCLDDFEEDEDDEDDLSEVDLRSLRKKVADVLAVLNEGDLEEMFGDHVRVTVTPDSIQTESYTHHD